MDPPVHAAAATAAHPDAFPPPPRSEIEETPASGADPWRASSDGSASPPANEEISLDDARTGRTAPRSSPSSEGPPLSAPVSSFSIAPAGNTPAPPAAAAQPREAANPYFVSGSVQSGPTKGTMETVKEAFWRWKKAVGDTVKLAGDLSRDTVQHFKTAPSLSEAAMSRLAYGTKVIAEGGYDRIFRQTFDALPEEQLRISFSCYMSTTAGPVVGNLYISTERVAFCSDNPMSYSVGDKKEWSYYKVVIPLQQLRTVNPSTSKSNSADKYIQIISHDEHEFWFMGFLRYESAITSLQEAMESTRSSMQP